MQVSCQGHVVLSGWWEIWQPHGRLLQHGCWQLASSCPVCQTDWLSVALLGRDPAVPAPTPGRARGQRCLAVRAGWRGLRTGFWQKRSALSRAPQPRFRRSMFSPPGAYQPGVSGHHTAVV